MDGHRVRVAYSGPQALQSIEQMRPDAVLLDIGMPEVDGYQVARVLRASAATAGIRLIAVTGWGTPEDTAKAREAGFDSHLTKPIDFDALALALA
jgi:two-component system CheB/CheR fusion protein